MFFILQNVFHFSDFVLSFPFLTNADFIEEVDF